MDLAPFLDWAQNQGVAVAILAFVLIRLESRLGGLHDDLKEFIAWQKGKDDADRPPA